MNFRRKRGHVLKKIHVPERIRRPLSTRDAPGRATSRTVFGAPATASRPGAGPLPEPMRQLVNPRTFGRPSIGLALFGCKNRPFYQLCVFPDPRLGRRYEGSIIEQLGTFDPLPNYNNEKLVSMNIGRIKYWIGEREARVSVPVLELLGLAGLLPIHPKTFIRAKEAQAALNATTNVEQAEKVEQA